MRDKGSLTLLSYRQIIKVNPSSELLFASEYVEKQFVPPIKSS